MIDLSLLDPGQLSAAAQRALGPGPGRMMASKGMLPLPPADQVAVLYQLHLDADAVIAGASKATAASLPDKLLVGTLADPALDPRVLHFFGTLVTDKPQVFDAIVLNPSVHDTTLAVLAGKGDARGVDQIAQNEQRLLRHPEIIAAMYMNRKARMSTIDRVVELAVRNNVRVPGLAAWDEVARALTGHTPADAKVDAVFDHVVERLTGDDRELTTGDANVPLADHEIKDPEKELPFNELSIPAQIRIATLGNAVARGKAIRSAVKIVAIAAIKSPGVTEIEAARYAGNPGLGEDVIRYIAVKREWTKLYAVKVALCRNPKTPISESAKLMPFLRERDLLSVSNSRGIPSAVVGQAKKLMIQRRGGEEEVTPGFVARLGLSITNPRSALAVAADRRHAGRSGTDLFVVILLTLAAAELRGLFGAAWLGAAVQIGLGVRAAIQVLTRALTVELAFLVIAAFVLWLAAGRKRDLGRAFDLACVAALPLLVVDLVATVVVRGLELGVPAFVGVVLAGISYAWAGVLLALALRPAREPASVVLTPVVVRRARGVGWGVLAIVIAGTTIGAVWIARHSDSMRPMTQGDPAPAFTLSTIAAGGSRGAPVSLEALRGKVVVLDFWATWCGPCLKAMPKLDAIAKWHPDVAVIAINLDDPAAARALWDDQRYRVVLAADDGQVSARYGVSTIPHSVVIDRAGIVRMVARGTSHQLEATVNALVAEQIRK